MAILLADYLQAQRQLEVAAAVPQAVTVEDRLLEFGRVVSVRSWTFLKRFPALPPSGHCSINRIGRITCRRTFRGLEPCQILAITIFPKQCRGCSQTKRSNLARSGGYKAYCIVEARCREIFAKAACGLCVFSAPQLAPQLQPCTAVLCNVVSHMTQFHWRGL